MEDRLQRAELSLSKESRQRQELEKALRKWRSRCTCAGEDTDTSTIHVKYDTPVHSSGWKGSQSPVPYPSFHALDARTIGNFNTGRSLNQNPSIDDRVA